MTKHHQEQKQPSSFREECHARGEFYYLILPPRGKVEVGRKKN